MNSIRYMATGLLSLIFSCSLLISDAFAEEDTAAHWFTPDAKNLVYLRTHAGEVVIMLSEDTAPIHKQRFIDLVNDGFYDGKYFYRVIDGFVAQGGSNEESQTFALATPLKGEFSRHAPEQGLVIVEENAAQAPVTGFLNGMPVGANQEESVIWHTHCPGTVAFARGLEKDSATTEFYIVIGQAPHHLDKNMSVIGRVLDGMQYLQRLPRGERAKGGVIDNPDQQSLIVSAVTGDNLPPEKRRKFRLQRASHPKFKKSITSARNLDNAFFHDKSLTPRKIDVCYYQPRVEEITEK